MNHVITTPPTMKLYRRDQARPLQVAKAHDRMTTGAAARIACTESHTETTHHKEEEPPK